VAPGEPIVRYLARRTGVADAERKLNELARRLEIEPGLAAEHAAALERGLALGGAAVVSHDRAFLERAATRIVELDEHTRQAREFAGGWSSSAGTEAGRRRCYGG
jgi:ATPase subunit of ABC transporter with duplicated ATPase domains